MSNASPTQNSTINVLVSTSASASVATLAHYKTTATAHTGTANSLGKASIAYRISRATKGYRVVVSVTVRKGSATGTCSTAFVPR
jgi:ribosomal protein S6